MPGCLLERMRPAKLCFVPCSERLSNFSLSGMGRARGRSGSAAPSLPRLKEGFVPSEAKGGSV